MRAAGFLLLGLGGLQGALFGAGARERVIAAGIKRQPLLLQMQDMADGAVQQVAIMADDDDGMGIALQIAFQPQRAFKIQIVGRFVQQQQVGLREQHPRQRHPHPPAAGIVAGRPALILGREAEPLQDGGSAGLGRPGVDIGQPGLDFGDAGGVGGVFGLGQKAGAFGIGGQHRVQNAGRGPRRLLRDAADAGAGRQADGAAVQMQLVPDQLEQRRLAGAVRADKADLVAAGNGRRGVLEQRAPGNGI